jgi:IS30 family transposase
VTSHATVRHVRHVVHEINNRPRKLLNYDTPAARFRVAHTAQSNTN